MAVYQGARLRTDALPAADSSSRRTRASAPATSTSGSRVRPMGMLMAVIVAATMLGLVYLTQTLGSNATSTEIFLLEKKSTELFRDTRNLQIQALRNTEAEAIVPRAKKQQLKKLGGPIVVLPAP